jgi:hypothetical protein
MAMQEISLERREEGVRVKTPEKGLWVCKLAIGIFYSDA